MKWQYAVLTWLAVFVASLAVHEAGHLALQKAWDSSSKLDGMAVLGFEIGQPSCQEWQTVPVFRNCASYHAWNNSPFHSWHDAAFQVFGTTMFAFPFAVWWVRKVRTWKTTN